MFLHVLHKNTKIRILTIIYIFEYLMETIGAPLLSIQGNRSRHGQYMATEGWALRPGPGPRAVKSLPSRLWADHNPDDEKPRALSNEETASPPSPPPTAALPAAAPVQAPAAADSLESVCSQAPLQRLRSKTSVGVRRKRVQRTLPGFIVDPTVAPTAAPRTAWARGGRPRARWRCGMHFRTRPSPAASS